MPGANLIIISIGDNSSTYWIWLPGWASEWATLWKLQMQRKMPANSMNRPILNQVGPAFYILDQREASFGLVSFCVGWFIPSMGVVYKIYYIINHRLHTNVSHEWTTKLDLHCYVCRATFVEKDSIIDNYQQICGCVGWAGIEESIIAHGPFVFRWREAAPRLPRSLLVKIASL